MATIEDDLSTVIETECPRVFPDFAPTDTPRPYVTYQQIGGKSPVFTEGALPNKKHGEFQVNVWADSRMEASALALAIEAALVAAAAFQCEPLGAFASDFDADMERYGTRQDFSIWSSR